MAKDLKKCEKVEKCWSIDGITGKFKLNDDNTVHMMRDGLHFYNGIHVHVQLGKYLK